MSFMLTILGGLKMFARQEVTDDITDRLHYQLTSALLVMFSILVSFKQFGGKPIECLIPDVTGHFDGVEEYAENYCFAQSTYYMKFTEQVMYGDKTLMENSRGVSYYQWVPFFLIFAAAMFQLPYMVWRVFANHSGIRIHDLVNEVKEPKNMQPSVRKETVENLSIHLGNALKFHRRLYKKGLMPHKFVRCLNLPYTACYVTSVYLLSKVLYLINIGGQFLLLNRFLRTGNDYSWYGLGVMNDLIHGDSWHDTGAFPRVTLCNFQIRSVGQTHNFTLQCVLIINMFNEKIFILLWFWYQILCCLTVISLCYWTVMVVTPFCNRGYITRHLNLADMPFDSQASCSDVAKFVSGYLHSDGMFVIRMVEMNTSVIFGTELVATLWKKFYNIEDCVMRWKSMSKGGEQSKGGGSHDDSIDTDELPIALPPPPIRPPKHLLGNQFSAQSAGPNVRFRTSTSKTSGDSNPIPYPGGNKMTQQFQGTPWAHHFTGPQRSHDSAPLLGHGQKDPNEVIVSPEHLKGESGNGHSDSSLKTQQAPWRWPNPGEKPNVPPKPQSPSHPSAPLASGEQSRMGSYRNTDDENRTPTRSRNDVHGHVSLDMVDKGESHRLL